jgi:hypothetical protein
MTELKTKILHIVSKENIKMIPKWKFVLYSGLGILGIIFAFLLAVFTGSLILFVLSKYGFLDMSFFEFIGTLHALKAIPTLLLIFTVLLLILIEVISRSYTLSFRRPLGITLLAITSVTVVISFLISKTDMHETIRDYAKSHRFDMMSKAYDRPRDFRREDGVTVVRGLVIQTSTTSATVKLFNGDVFLVEGTTTGKGFNKPEVGSDVIVFGTFNGEKFEVKNMRVAAPASLRGKEGDSFRGRPGMHNGIPYPFFLEKN